MSEVQEALRTEIRKYQELKARTSPHGSLGSAASSPPHGSLGKYSSVGGNAYMSPPKGGGYSPGSSGMVYADRRRSTEEGGGGAMPVPVQGARRV
eukprot:CAMPEP_0173385924 /NCGR_PEP_ID=MMETSP1356-20130122/8536_1 /TAXON_ID=77927 ORGANISM="Hemiselmis virescens, Strain PCC157" /NCGR_SAMPLE_ID=MMETSP1356 /ASSEMBLY_ACC=CAM_ASM_000847 /LENGTH=94 /DNA_ID=CAMNT_0014341949 /DNA_START=16 /DNA_END=300 /DNA_ORIENTATION=+